MIIDLVSPENASRDYPENSFTIIEHVTRGLMGVQAEASTNTVTTLPTLDAGDWAEMKEIPVLSNSISVKHEVWTTTFTNHKGAPFTWRACLPGNQNYLYVNGKKRKCDKGMDHGKRYASLTLVVKSAEVMRVSVNM